eukprot:9467007-Pyramimonas_sp.AAC.1
MLGSPGFPLPLYPVTTPHFSVPSGCLTSSPADLPRASPPRSPAPATHDGRPSLMPTKYRTSFSSMETPTRCFEGGVCVASIISGRGASRAVFVQHQVDEDEAKLLW